MFNTTPENYSNMKAMLTTTVLDYEAKPSSHRFMNETVELFFNYLYQFKQIRCTWQTDLMLHIMLSDGTELCFNTESEALTYLEELLSNTQQ